MASVGKLTRAGLAKRVADRLGYTKKDADLLVRVFFGSMAEALRAGEGVEMRGFGSFRVQGRAQRMGRNPRNGQPVVVPPKTVVHFRLGKELRNGLAAWKEDGEMAGGGTADGCPAISDIVSSDPADGGIGLEGKGGAAGGNTAVGETMVSGMADSCPMGGGMVDGGPATSGIGLEDKD